ncbi:Uncharacterized protein SCF082_LOCUS37378 [Durusdinium trenchii]|uniref:BAH domain-containing protein n=1 Tax=Durusdinium trenchii TaxID=1381693 RepID=A0ABP0PQI6_9DINO
MGAKKGKKKVPPPLPPKGGRATGKAAPSTPAQRRRGPGTPTIEAPSTPGRNLARGSQTPTQRGRQAPSTPGMLLAAKEEEAEEYKPLVDGDEVSAGRYFHVAGHLHLGLSLVLGKVYSESDLQRRCRGDHQKLQRLQDIISEGDLLTPAAPPTPKASGKRKTELTEACPESARPEERQKLKRRAMSRRICIGQLVWDCAQQPPRAAKVTAIAPERPDPFLIRHLDAPKRPSDFKVHDEVLVDGRHGVCIWDGRPDHHFGRVRWEDGTESDVIHVERIRPAEDAYIEDTWAYDDQLEALDIKHLLQPSVTEARSSADVPGPRLDVPDVPVEVLIRRSSRSNKLAPQQVAWSLLPGRPPWPVKLISSIEGFDGGSSSRQWNVKLLGTDQEETVLASRLSPFLSGDALALGKIAQEAEAEHQQVQNTDGTAAAVAAAAAPLLAPLSGEKA